ncbi:DUF3616 domain-containing protein [Thermopolyspora sp. NPDC052614]|uniref:DUF3616 domain-containing protein n=1 Tax=Thermopolyspora sp. NPDC052614 TaxID=3155682 RepID=UPI0034191CC2
MSEIQVERRVELCFDDDARASETHTNLSAVRQDGACLWVAGDETATIERLTAVHDAEGRVTGYADHRTVRLADLIDLPAGPDDEADIEGLARAGAWLWAIGSHSLKRRRIRPHHSAAKARRRLATVVREPNRFILARLPVVTGPDGLPEVRRRAVVDGEARTAAVLGAHKDALTDLLEDDPHLAPFLALPGKDNGVDIEGIAAHGDRLYIGLRGPVLRGWAVLIEIRPRTHPHHDDRLELTPLEDGALYRTHFLDLSGLGIRDLCPHGDDLLILAGPSMDLDGPVRVLRWPGAAVVDQPEIVSADRLEVLLEPPYGDGDDHAEGIALLREPVGPGESEESGDSGDRLLIVYDSPAASRLAESGSVYADVVSLPR